MYAITKIPAIEKLIIAGIGDSISRYPHAIMLLPIINPTPIIKKIIIDVIKSPFITSFLILIIKF